MSVFPCLQGLDGLTYNLIFIYIYILWVDISPIDIAISIRYIKWIFLQVVRAFFRYIDIKNIYIKNIVYSDNDHLLFLTRSIYLKQTLSFFKFEEALSIILLHVNARSLINQFIPNRHCRLTIIPNGYIACRNQSALMRRWLHRV